MAAGGLRDEWSTRRRHYLSLSPAHGACRSAAMRKSLSLSLSDVTFEYRGSVQCGRVAEDQIYLEGRWDVHTVLVRPQGAELILLAACKTLERFVVGAHWALPSRCRLIREYACEDATRARRRIGSQYPTNILTRPPPRRDPVSALFAELDGLLCTCFLSTAWRRRP